MNGILSSEKMKVLCNLKKVISKYNFSNKLISNYHIECEGLYDEDILDQLLNLLGLNFLSIPMYFDEKNEECTNVEPDEWNGEIAHVEVCIFFKELTIYDKLETTLNSYLANNSLYTNLKECLDTHKHCILSDSEHLLDAIDECFSTYFVVDGAGRQEGIVFNMEPCYEIWNLYNYIISYVHAIRRLVSVYKSVIRHLRKQGLEMEWAKCSI